MTAMDHIVALEAERQALYAQQDLSFYDGYARRQRLGDIASALTHWWAQERAARAERRQAEDTPAWATVAAAGRR